MGPEQDSLKSTPANEDTRSSSEIKGDIRQTRDRLDNTLETLNQRLSPRSLINDVLSWLEGSGGSTVGGSSDSLKRGYQSVVRQIKENPVPALMVGAGITWMILGGENDDTSTSRHRSVRGYDVPPEPLSPRETESASGIASAVKKKVGDAHEALSNASETITENCRRSAAGFRLRPEQPGARLVKAFVRVSALAAALKSIFKEVLPMRAARFRQWWKIILSPRQ